MKVVWAHGDPREVIRAIVADGRYDLHPPGPPPQPSWFDVLSGWVMRGLRSLLHGLDRVLGARNPFETAIGFAVIVAAFGLLGFGIYALVRSYLRGPRVKRGRSGGGEPLADDPATSAVLRAAALAAARARRYREAAALLFSAAVRALDERGRVAYDPARTPGEYRRLVRDPTFDALASDAVVALFAAAEPPGDLFERMDAAYECWLATPAP